MAEGGKAKAMEDFERISSDYKEKLKTTHEELGRAWMIYMDTHHDSIASRRRKVMGRIIDLIPIWRELADNSEVVLGSGNMIDHSPLYKLINGVHWPDPDPRSFAVLTMELLNLMSRVSQQLDEDAEISVRDANLMIRELQQNGIDMEEPDDNHDESNLLPNNHGDNQDVNKANNDGFDNDREKQDGSGTTQSSHGIVLLETRFGVRGSTGPDGELLASDDEAGFEEIFDDNGQPISGIVMLEARFGQKTKASNDE